MYLSISAVCLRVLQDMMKLGFTHNSWHSASLLNSSMDPVRVIKCHATNWAKAPLSWASST